jgi:rhomboid protease GluP
LEHRDIPDGPAVAPVQSVRLSLPLRPVRLTYVLLVLNGLVFLAMTALGGSTNTNVLIFFGAKYNPLIAQGQYWRLVSSMFLHIGLLHLLFNSYALYALGVDVERRLGPARFIVLYLLAGVGGSVLSYVGNDHLSAGASGAIFGLIGAITVYFVVYREQFGGWGRRRLTNLAGVIGLNLVYGLANTGIDNFAHIGGLLVGALLGWAYCPRYRLEPDGAGSMHLVDRLPLPRAVLVSLAVLLVLVLTARWGR